MCWYDYIKNIHIICRDCRSMLILLRELTHWPSEASTELYSSHGRYLRSPQWNNGSIGDKIKGLYVDFNESILIFNDIFYATCFLILTLYLLCRSLSNFSAQRQSQDYAMTNGESFDILSIISIYDNRSRLRHCFRITYLVEASIRWAQRSRF